MSSNLSPGVTENMLPGNTPEDWAWDELYDQIGNDADDLVITPWEAMKIWKMGVEVWKKRNE